MNIHVVHHVHIHVHVPIQCTCTDSEGQSVVGIMMSLHRRASVPEQAHTHTH